LIYAAVYWFTKNSISLSVAEKCLLASLTLLAAIVGIALLVIIQYDLGQARLRVQETDSTIFDEQESRALGIERYRGPHARGLSFLAALIGVAASGAGLLIWSLWR
jgi:hypothetical protein